MSEWGQKSLEKVSHSGNQLAHVRGNLVEREEEQKKKRDEGVWIPL